MKEGFEKNISPKNILAKYIFTENFLLKKNLSKIFSNKYIFIRNIIVKNISEKRGGKAPCWPQGLS